MGEKRNETKRKKKRASVRRARAASTTSPCSAIAVIITSRRPTGSIAPSHAMKSSGPLAPSAFWSSATYG
eukprot:30913-Pelagococcus_subviridis.AAC.5